MNKEVVPQAVDWSLAQIWNAVAIKPERPLVKRDYVYASELGQPMCDRILKMNAVPMTNPPNDRSRRKFLAGNIMEFVVKQILIAAGIYIKHEVKLDGTPYNDCLDVHGRCDFITVNGYIDQAAALDRLNELSFPEEIYNIGKEIIKSLDGVYMKGKILELKAVSTFAFDRVEKTKTAIPAHCLQAYHYQKNGKIEANVCYVNKDDMRCAQFFLDKNTMEDVYRKDLEKITWYYRKKKTPPIEPLAKFDESLGKFQKNLGVEYSGYLTTLYGFKNPDDYRDNVKFVESWNRVLKRYVKIELGHTTPTGKPLSITPSNKETRNDIEAAGYNFDNLIRAAIEAGIAEEEELAEF